MLTGIFKPKDSSNDDGTVSQNGSDDGRVNAAMVFEGGCASPTSSLARLLNSLLLPMPTYYTQHIDTRSIDIAGLDL